MAISGITGAQSVIRPGVCTSSTRPASPYDGQVIYMTDVDQTAVWDGSQWTVLAPIAGGRNRVINGDFKVWQRGTSFTTMNTYTADRWFAEAGTGRTITRQVTGDTTNLPDIQYCLRYQRNSGNTSTAVMVISQSIETANSIPLVGKRVTYSFYARAGANYSGASNALVAYLVSGTGTDQNQRSGYTGQALPIMQNATLTTTWQRFSFTANVPTSVTELAVLLEYVPVGTAGANDYFEATGFQLEAGAVATPFEFEEHSQTLQKCQRYCEVVNWSNFYGAAYGGTDLYLPVYYKVTKRTTPTVTLPSSTNAIRNTSNVNATPIYAWTALPTVDMFNLYAGSNSIIAINANSATVSAEL